MMKTGKISKTLLLILFLFAFFVAIGVIGAVISYLMRSI
jgi:hypothetical protein